MGACGNGLGYGTISLTRDLPESYHCGIAGGSGSRTGVLVTGATMRIRRFGRTAAKAAVVAAAALLVSAAGVAIAQAESGPQAPAEVTTENADTRQPSPDPSPSPTRLGEVIWT